MARGSSTLRALLAEVIGALFAIYNSGWGLEPAMSRKGLGNLEKGEPEDAIKAIGNPEKAKEGELEGAWHLAVILEAQNRIALGFADAAKELSAASELLRVPPHDQIFLQGTIQAALQGVFKDIDFAKLVMPEKRDLKAPADVMSAERHSAPDSEIIDRAVGVIGDREEALRWMGTPIRALDYATPISCLRDERGQAEVLRVLTQLEHGIL